MRMRKLINIMLRGFPGEAEFWANLSLQVVRCATRTQTRYPVHVQLKFNYYGTSQTRHTSTPNLFLFKFGTQLFVFFGKLISFLLKCAQLFFQCSDFSRFSFHCVCVTRYTQTTTTTTTNNMGINNRSVNTHTTNIVNSPNTHAMVFCP